MMVTSIRAHHVSMDHLTKCENCLANVEIVSVVSIIPGRQFHWSQLTIFCFFNVQDVAQPDIFDQP